MKERKHNTARKYSSKLLENFLGKRNENEFAKTKNRMLLAVRIADALKSKGMNKIQFSRKIGQEPSVITKWLSGTHNFTVDTLFDIQKVLGIKLLNFEKEATVQIINQYEIKLTTARQISTEQEKEPSWMPFGKVINCEYRVKQ